MQSDKKIDSATGGPVEAGQVGGTGQGPGAGPAGAPQPGEAGAAAAAPSPESEEVARLKAEAAELKDRLLRAHAEMDNVRKRLEKEKADLARFAITKFARDVVGIGDNVQRAIDAVPHKAAEQDPALKSFLDGITMIERELLSVLERHGVKRLDPKGEPFNPHFHQAVMEMPVADVPSGTITQVFQAGYTIEDRVLRPAMVVVAKGGMKPQAVAEAPAGAPLAAGMTGPHDAKSVGGAGGSDGTGTQ
jgi:molecular chaperone GrpE